MKANFSGLSGNSSGAENRSVEVADCEHVREREIPHDTAAFSHCQLAWVLSIGAVAPDDMNFFKSQVFVN